MQLLVTCCTKFHYSMELQRLFYKEILLHFPYAYITGTSSTFIFTSLSVRIIFAAKFPSIISSWIL